MAFVPDLSTNWEDQLLALLSDAYDFTNQRLNVYMAGATVVADLVDLDVFGITGGDGGQSGVNGKSLKDVDAQIALVLDKLIAAPATEASAAAILAAAVAVDLNKADQSVEHTHTTQGTAEEVEGATAFTAGALVMVTVDTGWVAAGDDKANAEAHGKWWHAATGPMPVQLADAAVSVWVDAMTDAKVHVWQVS